MENTQKKPTQLIPARSAQTKPHNGNRKSDKIASYLQFHPVNYCDQMDTLLNLIYQSYTEFNSVETPEFKAVVNPLDYGWNY